MSLGVKDLFLSEGHSDAQDLFYSDPEAVRLFFIQIALILMVVVIWEIWGNRIERQWDQWMRPLGVRWKQHRRKHGHKP